MAATSDLLPVDDWYLKLLLTLGERLAVWKREHSISEFRRVAIWILRRPCRSPDSLQGSSFNYHYSGLGVPRPSDRATMPGACQVAGHCHGAPHLLTLQYFLYTCWNSLQRG
jgi:hypothetical protein